MALMNRLYEVRSHEGLSQEAFASSIGLTQQNYGRYENGKQELKESLIDKVCKKYHVGPTWLLGYSKEDYDLLALPDEPWGLPECVSGGKRPVKGMEMGYVPLRGRVHAGKPTEPEVYEEEMVLIPQFLLDRDPDCWAGKSEGDCMNNVFPEGAIYVISPNKPHQNGRPEVWTIDEVDTVARRVYQTPGTLLLSPDSTNPENKDIVILADDDHTARYDGAIVWFQSDGEVE